MDKLRRSFNKKFNSEKKEIEKLIGCLTKNTSNDLNDSFDEPIEISNKKKEKSPNENKGIFIYRKCSSHEIYQNLNEFQKIYNDKRNMKDKFEENGNPKKSIIHINLSEIRDEFENEENDNFPEICIYFKVHSSKNIKNFNKAQSKNFDSKIIFPVESPSPEMKKEYRKANSANIKKKNGKNASSRTYLKSSEEFMRIVQAMKLNNK